MIQRNPPKNEVPHEQPKEDRGVETSTPEGISQLLEAKSEKPNEHEKTWLTVLHEELTAKLNIAKPSVNDYKKLIDDSIVGIRADGDPRDEIRNLESLKTKLDLLSK